MTTELTALDLLDPRTFREGPPHSYFDLLRQNSPVVRCDNPLYPGSVWHLTRFRDIREVGVNTAVFTNTKGSLYPEIGSEERNVPGITLQTDPPEHTRLRNMVAQAFSPRVVAQFEGWIREICTAIIDAAFAAGSFDAIPMIASELPAQVIARILGVPPADRKFIIEVTPDLFGVLDPDIGIARAHAAFDRILDFGVHLAETKRREPGADMVTELLKACDAEGDFNLAEYRGMFLALYTAGYETTHTLIAQALRMMAADPEIAAQVHAADLDGMKPVVEEFLRVACPVNYWGRVATRDTEIDGRQIRKDDYVMMWFTAANRDPEFFENPHAFIPGRPRGRSHAAFGGGGPHLCIGAHLARLEAQILLDEMNRRGLRLAFDGAPQRAVGIHINAIRHMPMQVVPV